MNSTLVASLVKVDVRLRSVEHLMLLTHWADNIKGGVERKFFESVYTHG